jgi:hypothetical protein
VRAHTRTHVCVRAHTHTRTPPPPPPHTHTRTHTHTHTRTNTHAHARAHTHTHTHTHTLSNFPSLTSGTRSVCVSRVHWLRRDSAPAACRRSRLEGRHPGVWRKRCFALRFLAGRCVCLCRGGGAERECARVVCGAHAARRRDRSRGSRCHDNRRGHRGLWPGRQAQMVITWSSRRFVRSQGRQQVRRMPDALFC